METLLGPFLSFVLLYKYVALFLIAFVASVVIPIPASTTLAAAGAFAYQGYLNIFAVLFVAFLGNVVGDATAYLLARYYGEKFLAKIGFSHLLQSSIYKKLRLYIFDFPQSLIYFTRFLTEMGPAVNILAGLSGVPPRTFFLYGILGEASYVLLYGMTGYILGTQWENNIGFLGKIALFMLPLGIVVNLIQYFIFRRRHKHL